jgi:biotin carboxyl carrier protein
VATLIPDQPDEQSASAATDPRAVRVILAPQTTGATEVEPTVLAPAAIPLAPSPRPVRSDTIDADRDGQPMPAADLGTAPALPAEILIVDGKPARLELERRSPTHASLVDHDRPEAAAIPVVLLPPASTPGGTVRREVLVDGWRIVVEIEPEQRAALRARARRGRDASARTGRSELRAVIPGRILSISVVAGDSVAAGQQVMVIEAMKMQNELRAPRDGVVASVAVGPGQTVELGDLLLVLE